MTTAVTYDGAGQVSSLVHASGATVLEGYDITRNVLGSPTEVTTTTGGATTSALYSYDVVGRLRTECYPASGEVCTSRSPRMVYTYDRVGNRLSDSVRTVSGTRATTVVTDYAYDVADQLLTRSVGGAPTVSNTWTLNGALASSTTPEGTQTFTTDLTDELISLELADGSTVGYTHDVKGNRTSRTVDGVVDVSWVWDELSSLPVRVGEYDASGTVTTVWLPDPASATGSPLAQSSGGASSWLLSDPFLNTVASVSTTGTTLSGTQDLNAFGVPLTPATGSLADAATGFAGQYLDDATGLYDMRARDYDPRSGRFTATDPVAVPTGSPYFSGYTYGYNNPLMFTDASGMSACDHMFGLCDSPKFAWNELVGAKNAVVEMGSAIVHPMDTYHGIIDSCNAGFADWNSGDPSFEGFLQCVDNVNPMAQIRRDFQASLNATCVEESGQAFGHGLAGVTATAAPFASGIGLPAFATPRLPALLIGSGPVAGVLEASTRVQSLQALKNYFPKDAVEYVFDPQSGTFVVGRPAITAGLKGSPHEQLAQSIGADPSTVVGGTLTRGSDGVFVTTENSGHFWQNWTPEVRRQFVETMQGYGLDVEH